jgi:hypothetical protein
MINFRFALLLVTAGVAQAQAQRITAPVGTALWRAQYCDYSIGDMAEKTCTT